MSQLFRNNNSRRSRPRYAPNARRIEGDAGQRPHEDAEDLGQADRDRREVGGALIGA